MTGLLSSLRIWWRWRMQRNQVHMPPFIVFRRVGTVVAVYEGYFRVEIPDGRSMDAMTNPFIAEVTIGDRVEIEPSNPSPFGGRWPHAWTLVRKLDKRDS